MPSIMGQFHDSLKYDWFTKYSRLRFVWASLSVDSGHVWRKLNVPNHLYLSVHYLYRQVWPPDSIDAIKYGQTNTGNYANKLDL